MNNADAGKFVDILPTDASELKKLDLQIEKKKVSIHMTCINYITSLFHEMP